MEFEEMKPHCRNAVAAFNMLRQLGFESDNIFMECSRTMRSDPDYPNVVVSANALFVCLRLGESYKNEDLPADFLINVAYIDDVRQAMNELAMTTQALATGKISDATYQKCMEAFEKEVGSIYGLVNALIRKKIRIPNLSEKVDKASTAIDDLVKKIQGSLS